MRRTMPFGSLLRRPICLGLVMISTFAILSGSNVSVVASASPALRTCTYSQLVVAAGWGPGGFAGNEGIPFVIINTGKTSCSLEGRPKLQLFTEYVNKTPIRVSTDVTGAVYGAVKPRLVILKPDSAASFGLDFGDALNQQDTNGPSCTAQQINVMLPTRSNSNNQGYAVSANFNICYSGFRVSVTSIETGALPKIN